MIFSSLCIFLNAQTLASDTLLFRECFSDSILKTDVGLMREVYYEVLGGPKVTGEILMGMEGIPSYTIMRRSGAIERVEEGFYLPWSISRNVIKSNINLILRRQLFQEYKSQHPRGWKIEEAKAALVRRLQRFDSLAVHRPLFFSTIYTDYGGDIVKYVDALYETAIMAKKKNLPLPDEERELDKAYWELTGYKFNQKKSNWFVWFLIGIAIALAWYFDLPELIAGYLN